MRVESRYLDGSYLQLNPDFDRGDAKWKANIVAQLLSDQNLCPRSIVEVGCGSGDILRYLREFYPSSFLVGYDISPQAKIFWSDDVHDIEFNLVDFHNFNTKKFDILLMLDVFEHVRDPFSFLENSRGHAKYFIFHIPLDLSAQSVARKSPLIQARRNVGHLHSYTKELALETLEDCGYEVILWRYTGASITMPNRSIKTWVANLPRKLLGLLNKDFAVRVLGGESLLVLAV